MKTVSSQLIKAGECMDATRRQFMWGTLGVALAGKLEMPASASPQPAQAPPEHSKSAPYGSSRFGAWIEDEFGLPAFRYTCNQTTDLHAATPIASSILGPTEHIHQVGNDRITALASNFGTVRVRQDEGCPKILNDIDPETSQFGGGFGYLTDGLTGGHDTLSTYYDGSSANFERIFGIGYFRKRLRGDRYSIDQVISAPFGDDPVLLSQVTVTNHRDAPATVRWVEYWGCQPHQFSFRAFIESWAGIGTQTELRRKLGRQFSHKISPIDGMHGLLESKSFLGRPPAEETAWQRMKVALQTQNNQFISPIQELQPGADYDSTDLPSTFLVSLDAPASGFSSDAAAFFGSGGPSSPSGLKGALNGSIESSSPHTGLLLERTLKLAPGETKTINFLYGYLPEGFALNALIAKYRTAPESALKQSSDEWKRRGMRFDVSSEPWVKRETTWNHYYLRSSQTYDDFFAEHILNQNGFYQYGMGFQGAARDPLQHCLPFLFSDPEIVRSVLRYTLKEVRDDGSIPYGITGHGVIAPMVADNCSDIPLWLLWTVSEYVLATRDTEFLNEEIPTLFSAKASQRDTVRNLLARCYHHQIDHVGVGEHGIIRMLNDDWNDGLLGTWAQTAFKECAEQGESVLNSAMSAWVFDQYARMLRFAGDQTYLPARAIESAEKSRQSSREQWTGKWLKRAWLGPTLGWLGESTLWIEPQPWAIVAGVLSPSQNRELVATMDSLLRQGPIGAAQMSEGPDLHKPGAFAAGTCVRGGVWPSLNQTLIWALAGIDPPMAWDEWKKNSFARHADVYPDVWYGVWSGTDSYNSSLSSHPGETVNDPYFHGTDFPVLNLHAHACSLYSITKLLNLEFTEAGLNISPELPLGSYRFDSPLLGVARSAAGHYEGWYAPSLPGTWTLTIKLPEKTASELSKVEINGTLSIIKKHPDGTIEITGASELHKPLRWALQSN
jgi:hypothetical protein